MRRILLSGLPGAMATEIAGLITESTNSQINESTLCPFALTSEPHDGEKLTIGSVTFELLGPHRRELILHDPPYVLIDYSTPDAMVPNAKWCCSHSIPFVMGTTGGDAGLIESNVRASGICAVLAPNMAVPIVLLLAAAEHLAVQYPGALRGHGVRITESHQATKRDTSGTAKAMVQHLQALGLETSIEAIEKVRDPERQRRDMRVPQEHLGGHAYHHYQLTDAAKTLEVSLRHNVNGRRVYAEGTLTALRFLLARVDAGARGQVWSMRDVLSAGA